MKKVIALVVLILFGFSAYYIFHVARPLRAGDHVYFGRYEQDNDRHSGSEPIEWQILEVNDGNALMLSVYGLYSYYYDDNFLRRTSWRQSDLRAWLNGRFYENAFNYNESSAIRTTNVDNSIKQGNPSWRTYSGEDTRDKVFLLSYAEAWKYLPNSEDRLCAPTAYASKSSNAYVNTSVHLSSGEAVGHWFLRTLGSESYLSSIVDEYGRVHDGYVASYMPCVRPAIWVNIKDADLKRIDK